MLSTRQIWRLRPIAAVSFQRQILSAAITAVLFFQGATLDPPLAVVRSKYLLVGGGSDQRIQPGITIEEDEQIVSGPPGSVSVKHDGELHEIRWIGTRDDTILGYQIYRRCQQENWKSIGFVKLHVDDPRNAGPYIFKDHFTGNCEYTVAAVGPDGTPGPKSVDIQ